MIRTRCMLLGRFVLATVGLAALAVQAACAADPNSAAQPAEKKYTAIAYLLVARQEPRILPREGDKETTAEFECFRSTQMQLIKSRYVIIAALRNPKLKSSPSLEREDANHHAIEWFTDAIHVRCPDERSGLLTVSLTSSDAREAALLVNAVVEAYLDEVVNRDRQARRELLDVLQRLCAEKEMELSNKRSQLERAREVYPRAASLERRLLTEHAVFCQHKLDELKDDRQRADQELQERKTAGGDVKQLQAQCAKLTNKMTLYEKELEQTVRHANAAEQDSFLVHTIAEDVRVIEDMLRRLTQERELLRAELNASVRVSVAGDRSCPATIPECPD